MEPIRKWLRSEHFQAIQGLSRQVAGWFKDILTGNQMTILGMIMCVPMAVYYWKNGLLVGSILLTASLLTDWVDGALARYQQGDRPLMTLEEEMQLSFLQRINYRGVTHLGRSLDPFADKVRFIAVLFSLGLKYVNIWLIVAIVGVALVLTIMRPIKQWLELDHVGSNRLGKFKVYFEIVGMASLVFLAPFVKLSTAVIVVNSLFTIALFFALCSLGGHVITGYFAHRARRVLRKSRTVHQDARSQS